MAAGHGITTATLICATTNTAAHRTIQAAGGRLDRESNGRRWYQLNTAATAPARTGA